MNYYQKYLKYKNKYLLLKEQHGGENIHDYLSFFFRVTDRYLNSKLKPILDEYWAKISTCYGLPSPNDFIFKNGVIHPQARGKPYLHRAKIAVFLSDHSPIHDERGGRNIISWNVGIGYDDVLFNYLRPIQKSSRIYRFSRPAIGTPDDLKLLELKARLIVEYIKYYKGNKTIVHLQECSGRLYKKICEIFKKSNEHFSSNFVPQTLIDVSLDLSTSISYYTMPPESHDKSGLCSFVFFPNKESVTHIELIPCITFVYAFPPKSPTLYNMTCRACKIKGLEYFDTFYNVHLDAETSYQDQRTLLKNETTNYIFQGINVLKDKSIYDTFIKIVDENYCLGTSRILFVKGNTIFGFDNVHTTKKSKIIIAGDFNQHFTQDIDKGGKYNYYSKITKEAFAWPSSSDIDYILFYEIE
jgi:hypothetical protein